MRVRALLREALLLLSLLRRKLGEARVRLSFARMVERLADIREVTVLFREAEASSSRALSVSEIDAEPQKVIDALDLARLRTR